MQIHAFTPSSPESMEPPSVPSMTNNSYFTLGSWLHRVQAIFGSCAVYRWDLSAGEGGDRAYVSVSDNWSCKSRVCGAWLARLPSRREHIALAC